MNYIYWLSQIQASERFMVGDNLFFVSQLLLNNYSVMPGFVLGKGLLREFLFSALSESIRSDLFDSFLQIDVNDYRALQAISRRSRQAIAAAILPSTWQETIFQAARQLNSQALILSPYLVTPNQQEETVDSFWQSPTCWLTPEALERAIKSVWQELFTAKSLFYYRQLELSLDRLGVAILIQPFKAAKASGTMEVSSNSIYIRATEGLIQSLLRGEVQPDTYELNLTGKLVSQQLGNKNYAYRLGEFSLERLLSCLEAYIPSETSSEKYILDSKAIAGLFDSTTAIWQDRPQTKYLEWILEPTQDDGNTDNQPQFCLTRLGDRTLYMRDRPNSIQLADSATQPLLVGLAASPGSVLATATVISDLSVADPNAIPAGCILVTKNVPPERISILRKIGGIIIETGGLTSHGAIIARELQMPAIVAATDATKIITQGQDIFLDGDTGEVHREAIPPPNPINVEHSDLAREISTKLMLNLSQPEAISQGVNLPVAGIGLLRAELMLSELLASEPFLEAWRQPLKRRQFRERAIALLEQFAAAFAPRPVFYRSLDLYAERTELRSNLSSRGTYRYLFSPELFDLELEALVNVAQKYDNLNLILPFIRSVAEFKFCHRRIERSCLRKRISFQVWIMAEVPSVLFLLPQYVRAGVQGIAIGTNDLTELLLGIDREQAHFSYQGLNETHPAVQLAIAQLIQTAKANNIPCSLCGQAPVMYPELIDKLVEWGITSISVEPQAVSKTYRAIARAEQRLRR